MIQTASQILQKVNIDKLPSLPHVLIPLLEGCQSETLSIAELAMLIKQDAGLFARFMSAFDQTQRLGGGPSVLATKSAGNKPDINATDTDKADIEQVLLQLDIRVVKSIIAGTAVQQFFSRISMERTEFLKQHWQHSLLCARVAYSIAKHCNYHAPDEAYSAGLLHDAGQLVLEAAFPDKYTTIFAQLSEEEYFHNLEHDEFKTTHQQITAQLLQQHGANSFMVDAVLYHHEKTTQILDAHPLVKIIHLANKLSNRYFKEQDQQVFNDAKELLDLDRPLLLEILQHANEHSNNAAKSLGICLAEDGMDGESTKAQHANDEFKQLQLAAQIRNIALLNGLHQHLSLSDLPLKQAEHKQAILKIIAQHTDILFGVSQSILFLYEEKHNRLHAIAADNQPAQLADVSVPLKSGRSLIADCLLNKQSNHSFDESNASAYNPDTGNHSNADTDINQHKKLSVIDKQLISCTRQQGILCLPLFSDNNNIGVLVLGTGSIQLEQLWKQLPLLMQFANDVAHKLSSKKDTAKPGTEIDDRAQMEQRIKEVQHEIRNPLSIMNNYLGILSHKLHNDKPAQEDVYTIKAEIERVNSILNRLSEPENPAENIATVDINNIISNLTQVFQHSLFADKNINISLELDKRIQTIVSNANTIKQIYTNLLKNAVEALPANGQIMVYTQSSVNVDGQEYIEISVVDDGPGIDSEILPKLFSPVDSTKGNEHAGLGLTIVKNLVSELHGSISCRSSDKGTHFHVLLPKH